MTGPELELMLRLLSAVQEVPLRRRLRSPKTGEIVGAKLYNNHTTSKGRTLLSTMHVLVVGD